MDNKELAEKLYEMAKDMDFNDYEELKDVEIKILSEELGNAKFLKTILERIVEE